MGRYTGLIGRLRARAYEACGHTWHFTDRSPEAAFLREAPELEALFCPPCRGRWRRASDR